MLCLRLMKPHWNKEKPSSSLLRIFFHILAALSLLKVGTARILRVERRKFCQCVLFLFQELWTSQGKKLWAEEVNWQNWNWWPRKKCCFVQRLAAKSNHLETKTWDHIRKNSQELSDKKCPEIISCWNSPEKYFIVMFLRDCLVSFWSNKKRCLKSEPISRNSST